MLTGTLSVGGRTVTLTGNALDAAILLAREQERVNAVQNGSLELTFSPADMKLLPREKIADERREKLELR
jgi:hypothetical protein